MPMRVTAEPLADDPTQQAFLYGPLVLAGQFPKTALDEALEHNQGPEIQEAPALQIPALKSNGADPRAWIQPIPGETTRFPHHRAGARRRPQAAEPKLATVCSLLEGIVDGAIRLRSATSRTADRTRILPNFSLAYLSKFVVYLFKRGFRSADRAFALAAMRHSETENERPTPQRNPRSAGQLACQRARTSCAASCAVAAFM